MKTLSTLSLFLFATFAAPVLAETPVKATPADACPLAGPLSDATAECTALRVAYRARINDCMNRMRADADARAGRKTDINSHTSRARYLLCDSGVRQEMTLKGN